MIQPPMCEPVLPSLAVVKSRIPAESWEARVEAARQAKTGVVFQHVYEGCGKAA